MPNKLLDVRRKQRLCYPPCLFTLTLRVAVSAHVNAAVRLFVVKIMFHLNKQKLVISFVICLLLSATKVFACGCPGSPDESLNDAVKYATEQSTVIFAGKVIGFEYRKGIPNEYMESLKKYLGKDFEYETKVVKFQVERWWKGEATTEVFLATDETKNSDGTGSGSSCDYHFKEGETYLVYANGKGNELRTHACARTRLLSKTEDLKILGEGKEPVEKKDEPNKSMDVRQIQRLSYSACPLNSNELSGGFAPRHLSR